MFLSDSHYPRPTLRVHPLAAISITHAIMRQPYSYKSASSSAPSSAAAAGADEELITVRNHRVLGGLVGSIKDNVVEIVDSFQVPVITEDELVKLDEAYLVKMMEFYTRTNKKEYLVGWYITSFSSESSDASLYDDSRAINSIFAKHCYNPLTEKRRNPIHLKVSMDDDDNNNSNNNQQQQLSSPNNSNSNSNSSGASASAPGLYFRGYIGKNLTDVFSSDYLNKNNLKVPVVVEKKVEANTPSIVNQLSAAVVAPEKPAVVVKEDSTWSFMFESLHVETVISDSEVACLHHLIHNQEGSQWDNSTASTFIPKSDTTVQLSLEKLLDVLGKLESYVTDVLDAKVAPIPEIGMQMSDIICSMEAISKDSVEEVYRDRLHDMLMVGYLTNLTKTQLQLADKIDSIL